MKRSLDRILTTHVGSLIRPQALQQFLHAEQSGEPFDKQAYEACLTQSVAEIVRRQAAAGIDVISDGEFGKSISWSQYALERLSGFERRPVKPGANPFARGADRERFPEFYAERRCARRYRHDQRFCLCRSHRLYWSGRARPRHQESHGGAHRCFGRGGISPGGCAGKRYSRSQERILQDRRGMPRRYWRGDAQRIPNYRRSGFPPATRRRACSCHL